MEQPDFLCEFATHMSSPWLLSFVFALGAVSYARMDAERIRGGGKYILRLLLEYALAAGILAVVWGGTSWAMHTCHTVAQVSARIDGAFLSTLVGFVVVAAWHLALFSPSAAETEERSELRPRLPQIIACSAVPLCFIAGVSVLGWAHVSGRLGPLEIMMSLTLFLAPCLVAATAVADQVMSTTAYPGARLLANRRWRYRAGVWTAAIIVTAVILYLVTQYVSSPALPSFVLLSVLPFGVSVNVTWALAMVSSVSVTFRFWAGAMLCGAFPAELLVLQAPRWNSPALAMIGASALTVLAIAAVFLSWALVRSTREQYRSLSTHQAPSQGQALSDIGSAIVHLLIQHPGLTKQQIVMDLRAKDIPPENTQAALDGDQTQGNVGRWGWVQVTLGGHYYATEYARMLCRMQIL